MGGRRVHGAVGQLDAGVRWCTSLGESDRREIGVGKEVVRSFFFQSSFEPTLSWTCIAGVHRRAGNSNLDTQVRTAHGPGPAPNLKKNSNLDARRQPMSLLRYGFTKTPLSVPKGPSPGKPSSPVKTPSVTSSLEEAPLKAKGMDLTSKRPRVVDDNDDTDVLILDAAPAGGAVAAPSSCAPAAYLVSNKVTPIKVSGSSLLSPASFGENR